MSILFGAQTLDRIAIISPDASDEILDNLRELDFEPVPVPRTGRVATPVSGHPDMQLFVHGGRVFCHPDMPASFLEDLERHADVVVCRTRLSPEYPSDVPYNIACIGTVVLHHHAAIDPDIAEHLRSRDIYITGVRQGYAKCSTLIVDDRSIITADASIHRTAVTAGLDSLMIRPGFIDLPGYACGFIGGATGSTENAVLCTGTLEHHPDYDIMLEYIADRGKKLVPLSRANAADLGTIFLL